MRATYLFTSLLTLLVAAPAAAQCTKDTDCKGQRICVGGVCQGPAAASAPMAPAPVYSAALPTPTPDSQAPVAAHVMPGVERAPAAAPPTAAPVLTKPARPAASGEWFRGYASLSSSVGLRGWGGTTLRIDDYVTDNELEPGLSEGVRLSGYWVLSRKLHLGGFLGYSPVAGELSSVSLGLSTKVGVQLGSRVFLAGVLDLGYFRLGGEGYNSLHGLTLFPRLQLDAMTVRAAGGFKWALFAALGVEVVPYAASSGELYEERAWLVRPTLLMGTTFGG